MFTKMVDKDGVFYTWMENGVPGPQDPKQRISQDMAYALIGPAVRQSGSARLRAEQHAAGFP